MATYTKFQPFVEHLAEGVHNFTSDSTCTITVALSATAPTNTWATLSQVTQISYTNLSARVVTVASSAQTSGTYKLTLSDLVLTASGDVATFRYVILYNDDPTSPADPLIAYYDYGSDVTLHNGETFTINFDDANGVFTIA
jgi:hypothetical protein